MINTIGVMVTVEMKGKSKLKSTVRQGPQPDIVGFAKAFLTLKQDDAMILKMMEQGDQK